MSQLKKVFEDADEKYRLLTKIPEEFLSTPHEFRKESEKITTAYETECSVLEKKLNESLATCVDTKEKRIEEINNYTKKKIQDLKWQRNRDLKISRKNVVKKLTKQQDLIFSLGVMVLAIILVLAGLVGLSFLIADAKNPERTVIAKAEEDYKFWTNPEWGDLKKVKELENKIKYLKSTEFDKSEFFSIFKRKGGIQLVITIILSSGLIYIYIRKILLFNSHKRLISSEPDNTSIDTDEYYQEKKSNMKVGIDKQPISASTTSPTPSPTSVSISEEAQRVYEQGLRLFEDGQKREGLDAFHRATEIDPNCVDACVALARGYHAVNPQKYYDELAHFAEQAFRAAPNNPKVRNIQSIAHFVKGKMAWDEKNWQEAALYFKLSYQIEPKQQTLAAFGLCAEEADELGIFADACEARLKEKPDAHGVQFMFGRTLVKMAINVLSEPETCIRTEYLRRAEEQLTTFLEVNPASADGNYWMGIIFSMTSRFDEAANLVVKLKDIDSEKSEELADLIDFPVPTTPLPSSVIGSQVGRDPDSIPVAELMRICQDNPKEGISLIDNMSNKMQQTDCIVLAKFYAYQTAVSKPFIESKIPLSSNPEEFMHGSQSDTIELCEKALEQIAKFESGNVTFTIWKKDNFKKSNPDNNPDDKTRADAVCTILDRLQPGRVQEILGRTRLSFFGGTRIGSVPGLNLNEIIGPESISCLQDILFAFPKVIRSLIAFEVKEQVEHGFKIVSCRVFEQATSKRPEEDPEQCLGILNLCVDGTYSYEVY